MTIKQKPRLPGRGTYKALKHTSIIPHTGKRLSFDDYHLPSPIDYYLKSFPNIPFRQDWAKVLCPFHDDCNPSLSINLKGGWFKCHACGAGGGGITKFHMMKYSLSFQETIKKLEGGRW